MRMLGKVAVSLSLVGTLMGGSAAAVPGAGGALSFDGADDRVEVAAPAGSALELTSAFTLEAWVRTTQTAAYRQIVCKNKLGAASAWYLALNNRVPAVFLGGTSPAGWFQATTAVPSGRWTHVAATFDGAFLRFYLDGVLDRTVSVSGSVNRNAGMSVWIGDRSDLSGNRLGGELDELRVWNRARTVAEIRADLCRKIAGGASGLVACWRFDEPSGNSVVDLSPGGFTGLLGGGSPGHAPARATSGAAIGDASVAAYPAAPVSLSHPDGDSMAIASFAGAPSGVHLYRVDEAPNVVSPPAGWSSLDPLRHWGVFFAAGSSPTATATCSFAGHAGLPPDATLGLAGRANGAALSWADLGATLDTGLDTLTRTGRGAGEMVLVSTGSFCPDILLTAVESAGGVDLSWTGACLASRYDVFRDTDASAMRSRAAWRQLPGRSTSEPMPAEDLVFYDVLPVSAMLTLDWTGEPDNDDDGDLAGFADDGFVPLPIDRYMDGIADLALSGDASQFRVKLTSVSGSFPTAIELLLDRNDDGDVLDAGETIPLTEVDPGDLVTTDGKLYAVDLATPQAAGVPPTPLSVLSARTEAGATRWARADATGTVAYAFRATDGLVQATGPATLGSTLTLLNTASELIDDLGKPVLVAGACLPTTDWATALVYFEEAEGRAGPASPYNKAFDADRNPDYLDAAMAAVLAETGWVAKNYESLWYWSDAIAVRDTMPDWIAFATKQVDRLAYLSTWAPSAPDAPWQLSMPPLCFFADTYVDPLYEFPAAEWDRTDAALARAAFLGFRGLAGLARVWEDPTAGTLVTAGDRAAIRTWLEPEADAKARAEEDCATPPCPLNGVDDDGDGLVDDLGYAARLFETFPGLGLYAPDAGLTMSTIADDAVEASGAFRQALRLLLQETDDQADDATFAYFDTNNSASADFTDANHYEIGSSGPDGLPDLAFTPGKPLPAPFCPTDPSSPEPITIRGGVGTTLKKWIDRAIDYWNDNGGTPVDKSCYTEGWAYTLFAADWSYYGIERPVAGFPIELRTEVEDLLTDNGIDPADLGPDFEIILTALESIDVRAFLDNPENWRDWLPHFCATSTVPACPDAKTYTFNGFFGDWDEPVDPIVPGKFWTIEPFSRFRQDDNGILDPACDPAHLRDCVDVSWDDVDGDGKYDLFEKLVMVDPSTPLHYVDLNDDGQWNGWTDQPHDTVLYGGETDPGDGLYNGLYVYFRDPTFGGRLPGMTNEALNNFVGAAAKVADGSAAFPDGNHGPAFSSLAETTPCLGGNYCFAFACTDADAGDTVRYKLIVPRGFAASGGSWSFDKTLGTGVLTVPPGTWGFIGAAYDNVENLGDSYALYWTVTR